MNDNPYPLIIIEDRYNGAYSGGTWLAFNCYPDQVPDEVFGDDSDCSNFWSDFLVPDESGIGKGDTVEKAIADLKRQMNS